MQALQCKGEVRSMKNEAWSVLWSVKSEVDSMKSEVWSVKCKV